jgi:hypothetical protein
MAYDPRGSNGNIRRGREEPYHFHISKSQIHEAMLRITALYVEGTGFGTWLRTMTPGKYVGYYIKICHAQFRLHYFQLPFLIISIVYYQFGLKIRQIKQ